MKKKFSLKFKGCDWTRGAKGLLDSIFDLVFPRACFGCDVEGLWLCLSCAKRIPKIPPNTCVHCRDYAQVGNACNSCGQKRHPSVKALFVAAYYDHPITKTVVHEFKYEGIYTLANEFAQIISKNIALDFFPRDSILCPIPMSGRKRRRRGKNHAFVLAKALSEKLPFPCQNLLKRRGNPKSQTKCSAQERIINASDTFKIGGNLPKTKNIILVDDIITTGATMEAAASCLKKAGFRVYGLAFAAG